MTALYRALLASLLLLAFCGLPALAENQPEPAIASPKNLPPISSSQLTEALGNRTQRVPEFELIREEAKKLGVRAWLFGGTAAAYGHYVKWDLQREQGATQYLPERFDYDYTSIYRPNQDLDIVIDGTAEQAGHLQAVLQEKYPHLQGGKNSAWEVRLLRHAMGDKLAILDNPDFLNQHSDSNSTGMIEITPPSKDESPVRDVFDWKANEEGREPNFLRDVREGKIHYYFSPKHGETKFLREGRNPPILSVIRFLTKAFQFQLEIRPEDEATIKKIIAEFDPNGDEMKSQYVRNWLLNKDNGRKLMQNAVNMEYAWDTLERLGLRAKLMAIEKNKKDIDTLAWWMNKEPLRSMPLGTGDGATARELGIDVVAHETGNVAAFESITKSPLGEPNVLTSRNGVNGEVAVFGDGFYAAVGRKGARGTGLTIRFHLHPDARDGTDFISHAGFGFKFVVLKNRRALAVIPESLNWTLEKYFAAQLTQGAIDPNDRGLMEKLNRRLGQQAKVRTSQEVQVAMKEALDSLWQEKRTLDLAGLKEIKKSYPETENVIRDWLLTLNKNRNLAGEEGDAIREFLEKNFHSLMKAIPVAKIDPGTNCGLNFSTLTNWGRGQKYMVAGILDLAAADAFYHGYNWVMADETKLKDQATAALKLFANAKSPADMVAALGASGISPEVHTQEKAFVAFKQYQTELRQKAEKGIPRFLAAHPTAAQIASYSRWIENTGKRQELIDQIAKSNPRPQDLLLAIQEHSGERNSELSKRAWAQNMPLFFRGHPDTAEITALRMQLDASDQTDQMVEKGCRQAMTPAAILKIFQLDRGFTTRDLGTALDTEAGQRYYRISTTNDLVRQWNYCLPKFESFRPSVAELRAARNLGFLDDEPLVDKEINRTTSPAELLRILPDILIRGLEQKVDARLATLPGEAPMSLVKELITSNGSGDLGQIYFLYALRHSKNVAEFLDAVQLEIAHGDKFMARASLEKEIDHFFSLHPSLDQIHSLYPLLGVGSAWAGYAGKAIDVAKNQEETAQILQPEISPDTVEQYDKEYRERMRALHNKLIARGMKESQLPSLLKSSDQQEALQLRQKDTLAHATSTKQLLAELESIPWKQRSDLAFDASRHFLDLNPTEEEMKTYETRYLSLSNPPYLPDLIAMGKAQSWDEAFAIAARHSRDDDRAAKMLLPPLNPKTAEFGPLGPTLLRKMYTFQNDCRHIECKIGWTKLRLSAAKNADDILSALYLKTENHIYLDAVGKVAGEQLEAFTALPHTFSQLLDFRQSLTDSYDWQVFAKTCMNEARTTEQVLSCLSYYDNFPDTDWPKQDEVFALAVARVRKLGQADSALVQSLVKKTVPRNQWDNAAHYYYHLLAITQEAALAQAKTAEEFLKTLSPLPNTDVYVNYNRHGYGTILGELWKRQAVAFAATHPTPEQMARFKQSILPNDAIQAVVQAVSEAAATAP